MSVYYCCEDRRRQALLGHPSLNGLDALEVIDDEALPLADRQRRLIVRFVSPVADLALDNFRIEGGVRIQDIHVIGLDPGGADSDGEIRSVRVELDRAGDFSLYQLRLVTSPQNSEAPPGFDPQLASIDFSFKAACASDLDCLRRDTCPPTAKASADISYLARDFASFRQLLLDRMASQLPNWQSRSVADLGVALVDLLAYAGDMLAYRQDVVGTEAYLNTARQRISIRRHARLVDYFMHEGCNARAWVQLQVRGDVAGITLNAAHNQIPTRVLTRLPGLPTLLATDSTAFENAVTQQPQVQVFELLHDIDLQAAHNEMSFYTWGARECSLPRGATAATLSGHRPDLAAGQVLILAEVRGPRTGVEADANPAKRHAVRLTDVRLSEDPLGGRFEQPPHNDPVPITEIIWHDEDALPFPLCLSALEDTRSVDQISVALGNVVLVDHGLSLGAETLPPVPEANPILTPVTVEQDPCVDRLERAKHPRYFPTLANTPLTFATDFDPLASAIQSLATDCRQAAPQIGLRDSDGENWTPQRDLLSQGALDPGFAVEIQNDGQVQLRFGDGQHGLRPTPGISFDAEYRVGGGAAGNVGAEALAHLVSADPAITADGADPPIVAVRNWLPARGGTEPETRAEVQAAAPYAFGVQERAVTSEDFVTLARRLAGVQRVQATPRWTGSWRTTFVSVDRENGQTVDETFEAQLRSHLEQFRLAGQDLAIDAPREVALDIEMEICVAAGQFPAKVREALLQRFHNGVNGAGEPGLFHPDNFSFGETVYLSPLIAAAQAVPGVASLRVTRFERLGQPQTDGRETGHLEMERLEIARLDNDPNFPERGVFTLVMQGAT